MKHKHCEVIKAWADGKTVQTKIGMAWLDMTEPCPSWMNDEYRVKPETVRYRLSVHRRDNGTYYTLCADSHLEELDHEEGEFFVRWLGDWQEVEV